MITTAPNTDKALGGDKINSKPNTANESRVSHEFHNFLADIEELVKATTSLTGDDLVKAKTRLNEKIAAAKATVEGAGESLAHRAQDNARKANHYIHEQPWQAIGIGTALGVLLGYLLARRG